MTTITTTTPESITKQQEQGDDGDPFLRHRHHKDDVDEWAVPSTNFPITYRDLHLEFGLKNPNLFSEIYATSIASAAIFAFADVRAAARNAIIDAPEVIQLPMTLSDGLQAYARNQQALQKVMKKADAQFLDYLLQQYQENTTTDGLSGPSILRQSMVHYFGDDDPKSECVYLLMESKALQRILLCFRGSITMNDWVKDSKVVMGFIQNPLHMRPDQPEKIGVHLGFREYLYDENRSISLRLQPVKETLQIVRQTVRELPKIMGSRGRNTEEQGFSIVSVTKEEQIAAVSSTSNKNLPSPSPSNNDLRQETLSGASGMVVNCKSRITRIMEEIESLRSICEDYRIYVTGHSLGGALGLLTSLEIAARWGTSDIPVTYVGIGNPRAATVSFRDAVETLEREGRMRCLGIHNHLDIVPMIPTSALHMRTKNYFCQVGFQLLLHPNKFEMRYCPQSNSSWRDLRDQTERMTLAILRPDKIAGRHHYMTYLTYLRSLAIPLSKLHLNDYYNDTFQQNMSPGSQKVRALTPRHVTTRHSRRVWFRPGSVCLKGDGESGDHVDGPNTQPK